VSYANSTQVNGRRIGGVLSRQLPKVGTFAPILASEAFASWTEEITN